MNITSGRKDSAQKVIIYGPEGIGKTTFAASFPHPLFIDTEGSTKMMDVRRFDKPMSWQMLLEQVEYVIKNPQICMTLVLDTADWAEQLAAKAICDANQKKSIEEFGYGKGFLYLQEEFGKLLNKLTEVTEHGINVVVTAHAQLVKFEQPDELGAYDKWELKLGLKKTEKRTAALLKEWADLVLFANYETFAVKAEGSSKAKGQGGKRVMYTTHRPCWDAKNRHGLPDKLDFNFANIAHIIPSSGSYVSVETPSKVETVELPPEEKEKRIEELKAKIDEFVEDDADESGVPPQLAELMKSSKITAKEIQKVVENEGYFPAGTPIANYGEDFINGWIITYWQQISETIIKSR